MKKRVLFLCTQNACRSQMAEALLRLRFGDRYEVYSAGIRPSRVNPWAVRVMAELGANISRQISEHLETYIDQPMDLLVTTCDAARETCPVFPGARKTLHQGFPDPATAVGDDGEILAAFREVRDQIDDWIQETFA